MLFLALREDEALHLRWSGFSEGFVAYTPEQTKTGKATALPVPEDLRQLLAIQRERVDEESSWVLPADDGEPHRAQFTRKAIQAAGAEIKARGLSPHRMRGTAATLMARAGVSAFALMRAGRWKRIETAQKYVHLAADDVRDALESAFSTPAPIESPEKKLNAQMVKRYSLKLRQRVSQSLGRQFESVSSHHTESPDTIRFRGFPLSPRRRENGAFRPLLFVSLDVVFSRVFSLVFSSGPHGVPMGSHGNSPRQELRGQVRGQADALPRVPGQPGQEVPILPRGRGVDPEALQGGLGLTGVLETQGGQLDTPGVPMALPISRDAWAMAELRVASWWTRARWDSSSSRVPRHSAGTLDRIKRTFSSRRSLSKAPPCMDQMPARDVRTS